MTRPYVSLCAAFLFAFSVSICCAAEATKDTPTIEKDKLGSTPNVTRFGETLFGGQPSPAALEEAQKRGVKSLITFRPASEVDWDEAQKAEQLGMSFQRIGFRAPESLTDELLDQARKALKESKDKPTMLYCGSANRVGAIWAAHRALDGGLRLAEALEEGEKIGLRSPGYVTVIKDYVQRNRQKQ